MRVTININLEDEVNTEELTRDLNKIMRRLKHKYNCSYMYRVKTSDKAIKNVRSRDYDSIRA